MTPLQPRSEHAADRHDRARRKANHDAKSLVGESIDAHLGARKHIAECIECQREYFVLAARALAIAQGPAQLEDDDD